MRKLATAMALILATGTICCSAQAAEVFTIKQDKPELTDIDLGAKGQSHGDVLTFEATFTADNGKKGVISGMVMTVDVPSGAHDPYHDRIENIVLEFGGQDTLVVLGKTKYPDGKGELNPDFPVVRAITGGTGRYIGSSGQMSTIRRSDGTYEHVVTLVR